jgi:hypothetical protein
MNQIIEWVNAVSVAVLVVVTAYYAWTTKQILTESEKMRKAAEKQASSAEAQASAAFATLHHLQQQVEDLQGLGRSIVRTTIDSTVRSIEACRKLDIKANFAIAETFPSPRLLPENAQIVLEHARRISDHCAILLTEAFDELREAENQIDILRRGASANRMGFFNPAHYDPAPFLKEAFTKLQEVRKLVS